MPRFLTRLTPLADLSILQRQPIGDDRGYLERLFCQDELQALLQGRSIVQINHTLTTRVGTVRGMHFQYPPQAEMKLISCLCGEVFDVAVDLRQNSPTFLHWHGEILSANNHSSFVIPEGFAHGFQTLTDRCELIYFHTAPYTPELEGGVRYDDSRLKIQWPLPVSDLSQRDLSHPLLSEDFIGIAL